MSESSKRTPTYNRYGFLSNSPALGKAGVSSSFVHDNVILRVRDLGEKANKALSLKPEDKDYNFAVEVLSNCFKVVESVLESVIHGQSKTKHEGAGKKDAEINEKSSYVPHQF